MSRIPVETHTATHTPEPPNPNSYTPSRSFTASKQLSQALSLRNVIQYLMKCLKNFIIGHGMLYRICLTIPVQGIPGAWSTPIHRVQAQHPSIDFEISDWMHDLVSKGESITWYMFLGQWIPKSSDGVAGYQFATLPTGCRYCKWVTGYMPARFTHGVHLITPHCHQTQSTQSEIELNALWYPACD